MLLEELGQEIDIQEISWLVPHSGPMVLLEKIISWDETNLVCLTKTYTNPNNPLKINNKLSSVSTIEYAAQAASYQAMLRFCKNSSPPMVISRLEPISGAYLGLVKDFSFESAWIKNYKDNFMKITVNLLCFGPRILSYDFTAKISNKILSHGKLSLVLEQE